MTPSEPRTPANHDSSSGSGPAGTSGAGRARRNRSRWAVPVGAVAAVAAVTAGVSAAPQLAAAVTGAPTPKSQAQVLTSLATAKPQPMSGTVVESADLGIPALPGSGSATSLTSLLSGSHTLRLWYASDQRERVAVLGDLAETDVVRDGANAWIWSSSAKTAQHLLLPAATTGAATAAGGAGAHSYSDASPDAGALAKATSPQQAAQQVLAMLGKTTTVTMGTTNVAGRTAYELRLVPKDARSLVARVTLAVDAQTSAPLRVQVFARGTAAPAFSTAYTAVTLGAPDASVFAFSPPPGATVTTKDLRSAGKADAAKAGTAKADAAERSGAAKAGAAKAGAKPVVTGNGWTSVVQVNGTGALAGMLGTSGASPAGASASTGSTGSTAAGLSTVLRAATPVSGSFGTGRLLRTRLLTVLLLDDGRVFAGAVDPSLVEQAAGK